MPLQDTSIEKIFIFAKQQYADVGVDVEAALSQLAKISISLNCWQGDDVGGFETANDTLGGGLAVTGSYPGKARTADELRLDIEKALSLIPGKHRLNLHACYAETHGKHVERNELESEHFSRWIDWAKEHRLGMDFNPTFFSHPKASDGFTLSHTDPTIRNFWVDHGITSRKIGADIGKSLGLPCVTNIWIPDGYKDTPVDRKGPRERLVESLDSILKEPLNSQYNLDAVECKLFGLGSESYVVGSHEFYLGYAINNQILLCLDAGHFHPTEVVSDKISSVMISVPEILLHVSRGVRWDSDHVVTLTDELQALMQEIVSGNYLENVHIGLDFFDASINRVAAWIIGMRCTLKALLKALLSPLDQLRQFERDYDFTSRLALQEEVKTLPFGIVWDYYCLSLEVPVGFQWMQEIRQYEESILSLRF